MNITPVESKIQRLVDNVQVDAQGWIDEMESITWVGGFGKRNPFYHKQHTPEIIERLRKANTGRSVTVETRARVSAVTSGPNNPFHSKHHTDASKRKIVETKIRNGTLGRFPDKTITLLGIAKELYDAGIDQRKIASLAINRMRANGMEISKVHAYRVLPQVYKNPNLVFSCRNSKTREWEAKMKALGIRFTPTSATKQCIECRSYTSRQWYHLNGKDQCSKCFLKKYLLTYKVNPEVNAKRNVKRNEIRRQERRASSAIN